MNLYVYKELFSSVYEGKYHIIKYFSQIFFLRIYILNMKKEYIYSNLIWDFLLSKNVNKIFGLPSSSIDNILNYIPKEIEWINVGNELQNGFVSQVYGSYSNNVGILCLGTGPGIATALSSIKNAECEDKPLLVITGFEKKKNVDFQHWNIEKISKQIVKYSFHVKKSNELLQKLILSYNIAKIYNTAVILTIDVDILLYKCNKLKIPKENTEMKISHHFTKENTFVSNKLILNKTIKELSIINNTKLLVILGKTNHRKYDKTIQNFLKRNNLPYVTTWKARTIYNTGLYCGRIGSIGNHSANYALYNCDNILLIGNMIEDLKYNGKEYHYDMFSIPFITKKKNLYIIDYKKKNKLSNTKIFVFLNFKTILDKLSIKVNNEWFNTLKISNQKLLINLPSISLLEKYAHKASLVHMNHKLDVPVTTGVGNHWYAIGKYMNFTKSNCFESDSNWASIGVGIANGLGIYYATKKHVWVFEGDGGALFSANNLFYLFNHIDIPMTITIYVNNLYAAVYSSFIIKGFDPINDSNFVQNLQLSKILPNCHVFDDLDKYYNYLNKNPISDKLRFIIINLGNVHEENNIYQINMNHIYEKNLKNDMFEEILKAKLTIVESDK